MTYGTTARKRKKKKKKGGRTFLLVVLLALLGGVGTWNYRRNVEAEKAVPRPYQSYSDTQLEQLIAANQAALDALVARYEKVSGHSISARDRGFVGDQIEEFERVQRLSRSVRTLGYEVSESEATLRELEAERNRRETDALGLKRLAGLVFTYSP